MRHSQPNLITVLQINRRTFIILLGNIILMLKLLFSGSFRASTLAYYYFLANSTGSFDSSGPEACVCVCVFGRSGPEVRKLWVKYFCDL